MHLFVGAADTDNHQQRSPVDHSARRCAPSSSLQQSAAEARIRLAHGSPPQFPTICSMDELWLLQSPREQARRHPLLVECVEKLFRGKDCCFVRSDGSV